MLERRHLRISIHVRIYLHALHSQYPLVTTRTGAQSETEWGTATPRPTFVQSDVVPELNSMEGSWTGCRSELVVRTTTNWSSISTSEVSNPRSRRAQRIRVSSVPRWLVVSASQSCPSTGRMRQVWAR